MIRLSYRFEFQASVPLEEAEMSLHLAMIALEGLFGRAGVRLDARYGLDSPGCALIVDGSTPLGESLVRVFTALLIREFGDDRFTVHRHFGPNPPNPAADSESLPQEKDSWATEVSAA